MRIAHPPLSSAQGMTVRVLHNASIIGIVLSLCVLVAWVSANPSAELFVQLGHSSVIRAVAWSPDGTTLASGSDDNTVKVWAWPSGELLRTLAGHSDWVWAVAWSPDGTTLASGSDDKTVKVWAWPSGELLRTLANHSSVIRAVAWSPDGMTLASGSWDNTVKVWAWPSGELRRTLVGHSGPVLAGAWSPDGKTLASGSNDKTVKVWAWPSGELLRTLADHNSPVSAVAWSPDGKTLASGSNDNTVKVWAWPSGELRRTLADHNSPVSAVAWSPDSKTLASGSGDNTVKVWDTAAGDIQMDITLLPGNEWLAYHPQKLVYNSSLQGDEYAAMRFDKQPYPVYPLRYYRQELKRTDLPQAFFLPQPVIQPKRLRWWWDRTDNKGWWLGGTLLFLSTSAGVAFILRKRADPMAIARRFFVMAGLQKVEAVSPTLLRLYTKDGHISGLVTLWHDGSGDGVERLIAALRPRLLKGEDGIKLYVVYKEHGPSSDVIARVRDNLGCETIPLASPLLEKALAANNCAGELKELEEPYITRIDPYAESKPIHDPTWFYGREDMLQRLPAVLAQGQHVGIFGLRKVGKTSLTNQLQQRFVATPTVFIDCQALGAQATIYWEDMLTQLHHALRACGVKRLPQLPTHIGGETFRQYVLALFALWEKSGQRGPFLVILDEIDKFFPDRRIHDSEITLAEYVQFFRVLRGLAQTRRCLVTLVIAYRPDVNRHNLLTPSLGENPMFQSFQEEYVGFLSVADSTAMVREIGQWKRIDWDVEAAQRVFHYCGGHPLVTRFFASHACDAGKRKIIDYARVEETAAEIQETFRRNEIGNYYKEGMWDLLREDEQNVLRLLCQHGEAGMAEGDLPGDLDDAVSNVEHFGLVAIREGRVYLTAHLFYTWLQRRLE
jgi:WD domain, G-beta repeat/AAA domain